MTSGQCAPHGATSAVTCSRCGAFACPACLAGTTLCSACRARAAPDDARIAKAKQYAKASWAGPVIGLAVNAIWRLSGDPMIKGLLFLGLCVMGFGCGLAALIIVRGARAKGVFVPAIIGMILSCLPLCAFLGGMFFAITRAATRD